MATAELLKSAVLRTSSRRRPTPTLFHLPGLLSRPVHEPPAWAAALEAATDVIREEYHALAGEPSDYEVDQEKEHGLHEGRWDWHSLVHRGELQPRFVERCPRTTELLRTHVPDLMTGLPFAFTFFSTMAPGATIAAHSAPCNLRLRCHLPLAVPEGAGMELAGEPVQWEEGRCLFFDDAYEHRVWNDSDQPRVLLLFDVWHPEIEQRERAEIVNMFSAARREGWLR